MNEKYSQLMVFLREIIAPCILFFMVCNFVIGSDMVVNFLDKYRANDFDNTLNLKTNIEQKILYMKNEQKHAFYGRETVIFIGTSSVEVGVDVELIEKIWKKNGIDLKPVNFGTPLMLAYNLPMIKSCLLQDNVKVIVYLYNCFSFTDYFHPQTSTIIWDTLEFIKCYSDRIYKLENINIFFDGVLGQMFFIIRYKDFIKHTMLRVIKGKLVALSSLPVYPNKENLQTLFRARKFEAPMEVSNVNYWMRLAFASSSDSKNTIGYRGLSVFLRYANRYRVPVYIIPIPEPDFSLYNVYCQGINIKKVDKYLNKIINKNAYEKVNLVDRNKIRFIEKDDRYFFDSAHFCNMGREVYSNWLAEELYNILR